MLDEMDEVEEDEEWAELVEVEGSGDCKIFVNTVLSAARNVPKRVRRRPQVVK